MWHEGPSVGALFNNKDQTRKMEDHHQGKNRKKVNRFLGSLRTAWVCVVNIICWGFGATSQELTSSPTSSPTVSYATTSTTPTPNSDIENDLELPTWAIVAMSVVGCVFVCSVIGLYVRNKRNGYEFAD